MKLSGEDKEESGLGSTRRGGESLIMKKHGVECQIDLWIDINIRQEIRKLHDFFVTWQHSY